MFNETVLGEVLDFYNGKAIKPGGEGQYPAYGSNGIIGRCDDHRYEDGIIIGRVGAYCGSVAYCKGRFWASDNTIIAKPKHKDGSTRFFAYMLLAMNLNRHAGGAAQPLVTQSTLKAVPATVPDPATQDRIASILSAYDDLIENNTRRIAILEEMARRIYEEWFVRFRFPGHEGMRMLESELGLVPEGWRSLPLAAFGDVITGKTPSKANPGFYGTVVPFLKTPDMHGNLFILATGECLSREGADSQRNKTVPARSLCVSCIGTIGVVSITTEPCQTNQQINSLVPGDAATLEFLYFRLKDSKKTLENLGANGATMGNVNKSKFEALSVLTPTRDLLKAFHAEVAPMFGLIQALDRKNVNLRATRDLLLPKLLSGELDVSALPEPEALAA